MTHREQATQHLRDIPRARLVQKLGKSLLGMAFIVGAGLAAWKLSWPWYVVTPVALFGAHLVSQDLTQTGVRFIVATVKDVLAAVRNGKGAAPPS